MEACDWWHSSWSGKPRLSIAYGEDFEIGRRLEGTRTEELDIFGRELRLSGYKGAINL